jgi:hypothetical protein
MTANDLVLILENTSNWLSNTTGLSTTIVNIGMVLVIGGFAIKGLEVVFNFLENLPLIGPIFKAIVWLTILLPLNILAWILNSDTSEVRNNHTRVPVLVGVDGAYNVTFVHITGNKYKVSYTIDDGQSFSETVTPNWLGNNWLDVRWDFV